MIIALNRFNCGLFSRSGNRTFAKQKFGHPKRGKGTESNKVAKQILKEAERSSFKDRSAEVDHDRLNEITDRHEDDKRLVLSNSIKLIVFIGLDSSRVDQISYLNESG